MAHGCGRSPLTREALTAFADAELVRRHCTEPHHNEILSELWRRHEARVRRIVRRSVFASRLHPPGWSPEAFADAAFSRAQLYFFRRVCTFLAFRGSFATWLSILTNSSVLDEYKYLKKFRELPDSTLLASEREADAEECGSSRPKEFRSQYLREAWWLKPFPSQDATAVAQERRSVVLRLLVAHANRSDENLESAQTIRLRYWREWTLAQLGLRLYGMPWSDRERNRQEQAVRRLLDDDYGKLRTLLQEHLGVTAFQQI